MDSTGGGDVKKAATAAFFHQDAFMLEHPN